MNEDQLWRQYSPAAGSPDADISGDGAVADTDGVHTAGDENSSPQQTENDVSSDICDDIDNNIDNNTEAADGNAPYPDLRMIAAKTAENARLTADAADIANRLAALVSELTAASEDIDLRLRLEELANATAQLAESSHANAGEATLIVSTDKCARPAARSFSGSTDVQNSVYTNDCFFSEDDEAVTAQKRPLSTGGLIISLVALVAGISIFCTVLILAGDRLADSADGFTPVNISFQTADKPDGSTQYTEANGKYTTEGIAKYVRPVIVEIYAYEDKLGTRLTGASYGSGVILTEDGYIVTNSHIIEDAEKVTVSLFGDEDKKEIPATVVGRDKKTDIAVIKIDKSGLPCAILGNSDEVVCGEQVCAVGNPEGFNASVTSGLVSAIGRGIRTDINSYKMNCIQSDAALSPGNSGGALVNMYGQVIGITSSKYVETNSEGLGFAITIKDALPIIEDILKNGYVTGRVRIGITFNAVSKEKAELTDTIAGLHIQSIAEECDISNTELREGDIIVTMNGVEVTCQDEISEAIDGLVGGDTVRAHVKRQNEDGTYKEFDIVFELMTDTSGNF